MDDVKISSGSIAGLTISGDTLALSLTGITNRATFTIAYPGISMAGDPSNRTTQTNCWQVLAGEATGGPTLVVNTSEYICIRGRIGQPITAANFRADLNVDGVINTTDLIAVRGRIDSLATMAATCP